MLTIRREQMQAFEATRVKDFKQRVAALLREVWPERCAALSETQLDRMIRSGFEAAESQGLTVEYDVSRFIVLSFLFGPTLESLPGAPEILASSAPSRQKLDRLHQLAVLELDRAELPRAR